MVQRVRKKESWIPFPSLRSAGDDTGAFTVSSPASDEVAREPGTYIAVMPPSTTSDAPVM